MTLNSRGLTFQALLNLLPALYMGGAWFANSCQGNAYDRGTNALRYVPRDCAMNILLLSLYQ